MQGESKSVVIGIGNNERETTTCTVVVELQEVEFSGPNEIQATMLSAEELAQYQTKLLDNESDHRTVQIELTTTGQRLRVAFMLYRGDTPAEPSIETAYHETHLWVNVSEEGTNG